MTPETRERFRRALFMMGEVPLSEADPAALTAELREAFLLDCSQGEENVACADRVEYGIGKQTRFDPPRGGLRLRRTGGFLSTIVWFAEGSPMPESLREALPDLRQDEWDAVLRMVTCILLALERREPQLTEPRP